MPILSQTQYVETENGVVLQARDHSNSPDCNGKMWCYIEVPSNRIVDHSMLMNKIKVYSLPCLDITVSHNSVFMAVKSEDMSSSNFDNKPEKVRACDLTKDHFIQCEPPAEKPFIIYTVSAVASEGIEYDENCQYIQCAHSNDRMYYTEFKNTDTKWVDFLAAVAARGTFKNSSLTIGLHDPTLANEYKIYLRDTLGVVSTERNGSLYITNSLLSAVINTFIGMHYKYGVHLKKPLLTMPIASAEAFLRKYLFLEGYTRWAGDSSSKFEFFSHRLTSLSMAFNIRQLGMKCGLVLPIISTKDRGAKWYKINTCGANTRRLMSLLKGDEIDSFPTNTERGLFNKGKYYARVASNEVVREQGCVVANTKTPCYILSAVVKC